MVNVCILENRCHVCCVDDFSSHVLLQLQQVPCLLPKCLLQLLEGREGSGTQMVYSIVAPTIPERLG